MTMDTVTRDAPAFPDRLRTWFTRAADAGASDLHLIPGYPPVLRLHGDLTELPEPPLDGAELSPLLAGVGKTTTLAMVVNLLNQAGGHRIITVEEPVEYLFPRAVDSVVTQREVGTDVLTFADGLRAGLRQDPDAILVGEVRDKETAQM